MKQEIILFYGLSLKAENLQKQIEKIRKKGFYSSDTEGQGPCDIREYNNHFSSITYDHPKNPMNLEYLKDFSINWKKYISPFKDWWPLWSYYFQRTQDTEKNKVINFNPGLHKATKKNIEHLCEKNRKHTGQLIVRGCKIGLDSARDNENVTIYYCIDDLDMKRIIEKKDKKAFTPKELRYLFRNWKDFEGKVHFFEDGYEVPAPWKTSSNEWESYKPKSWQVLNEQPPFQENQVKPETINQRICRQKYLNEIKNNLFKLKVSEQPPSQENQVKPETINQLICR